MLKWPRLQDVCKGVILKIFSILGLAPNFNNLWAVALWELSIAKNNAVSPLLSWWLTFAPFLINKLTTEFPYSLAVIRAVFR